MANLHTIPCSVVDSQISKPLLLRSTSSKRSTCTCGYALHEQTIVELVPEKLFTLKPTKILSFSEQLVNSLSCTWTEIGYAGDRVPSFRLSTNAPNLVNNSAWWNDLFMTDKLSPFQHMWTTLIRFTDLFSCHTVNGLCYGVNFCHPAMPRSACCQQPSCACSGVRLMLGGLSSPLSMTHAWSPCSRSFALRLAMSWALGLIEQAEQGHADCSNLARQSYGVLENWVDLILLNKLGPYATNSVQIEPDPPSFFEEPLCPISPRVNHVPETLKEVVLRKTDAMLLAEHDELKTTPFTIVIRDRANSVDASGLHAYPESWRELACAWDRVVEKRLSATSNSSNTVVVNLDQFSDADAFDREGMRELVHTMSQFSTRLCQPV